LEKIGWEVLIPANASPSVKADLKLGRNPGLAPDAGTTIAELALDFTLATRVALKDPKEAAPGSLAQQTRILSATINKIGAISGCAPTPCASWKKARSLRPLGFQFLQGFAGRASLLFPDQVKELLALRQASVRGFRAGEGHLRWSSRIKAWPPILWEPTGLSESSESVRAAVASQKLTGEIRKQYARMLAKVQKHNVLALEQQKHLIKIPAAADVQRELEKDHEDQSLPKFECHQCAVVAKWSHLAVFRKQKCERGNVLPMQELKEYKARKRCVEQHNATSQSKKKHEFVWPDDTKIREEMAKERKDRRLPPFFCKFCPKETPWPKIVSAMRQDCAARTNRVQTRKEDEEVRGAQVANCLPPEPRREFEGPASLRGLSLGRPPDINGTH